VSELELQEDREVSVKVAGATRAQFRVRTPRELVEQVERQREAVAKQRNSAALAGGAWFVAARKLPSGDITMVANSAAGAELLRKHNGWIKGFSEIADHEYQDLALHKIPEEVIEHDIYLFLQDRFPKIKHDRDISRD
jgi:hypothetical protein